MGGVCRRTGVELAGRRAWPSLALRWVVPALAILATGAPARADDVLPPRDYDAADPNRDAVTYLHAAANVALTSYIIWQFDWIIASDKTYRVTGGNISNNLVSGYSFDDDNLNTNMFGHPYGGGLHFGAARSVGLGFWETTPYAIASAVAWESLSERQPPSTSDVISSSLGGIALGEILYRVSSLSLDDSKSGGTRLTRELLAAATSPTRGMNRAFTGEAWADGAPPIPKPARITAHFGGDQVQAGTVTNTRGQPPHFLIALDGDYGDLLPANVGSTGTIGAYDFFDFHASGILSTESNTNGIAFSSLGLLHGWSSDMSSGEGAFRDNNVFGFFQSLDFQGIDILKFGAVGLGFGDFLVLRGGPRKRLRIGFDVEWTPIAAAPSPVTPFAGTPSVRNYNFAMGSSVGLSMRWDIGRLGQIGLAGREYLTSVVDGTPGQELIGYTRAWYEVDVLRDRVGLGFAPTFIHRKGTYTHGKSFQATQLATQLYLTVRL